MNFRLVVAALLLVACVARAGTVAHFKFEAADPRLPLLRLIDSSGNNHHGAVIGREPFEVSTNAQALPGGNPSALDARGRNDAAIIPHHADFAPTGDWTIEFYFKADTFHQEHGGATNIAGHHNYLNTNLSYTILGKPVTSQPTRYGSAWAFHYQPANGSVVATISYGADKGETLFAGRDFRDGNWHHIALVFKTSIENEVSLYIDGYSGNSINQHGGNVPIPFGDGPIWVGAMAKQDESYMVTDRNFDGFIDEIRFSDTALTTEGFLGDFSARYAPVPVEVFSANEIAFAAENERIYEIEASRDGEAWEIAGHLLGAGKQQSFFHRAPTATQYRVTLFGEANSSAIPFQKFKAAEIRFPTDDGQLYRIAWANDLGEEGGELTYVLGDGGNQSVFDRCDPAGKRFYTVNRY